MASPKTLCERLQTDLDLESRADQYYKMFKSEAHRISTATQTFWELPFMRVNGTAMEPSRSGATLSGYVLDKYKVYRPIPKNKGCVAKLAIEYERLNEDVPIPNNYMYLIAGFTKEIDAHVYAISA